MLRTICCVLWAMTLGLLLQCSAGNDFCLRPANMEICWWQNQKRYLRFGRGDPFLRFGRSSPFNRLAKRDDDPDSLEKYLENGGYLRFGRSVPLSPETSPLLALALRKRRDVRSAPASQEMERNARSVKDGGFLRFGRNKILDNAGQESPSLGTKGAAAKKADGDGDREYLRFGRSHYDGALGFGKRTYLRFGRTAPEGYLRFGKRSPETA